MQANPVLPSDELVLLAYRALLLPGDSSHCRAIGVLGFHLFKSFPVHNHHLTQAAIHRQLGLDFFQHLMTMDAAIDATSARRMTVSSGVTNQMQ
jgi:hypothetical protein